MAPSVITSTVGDISWTTCSLLFFYNLNANRNITIFTYVSFIQKFLPYVIFSVSCFLCLNWSFTSSTWCFFGQSALPFLHLRSTGLWGCKGQRGVWALDPGQGHTGPRLRSFPKPTCFVLLHTGTPLAPLTKFAIWSALTWVNNTWQNLRVVNNWSTAMTSYICLASFIAE